MKLAIIGGSLLGEPGKLTSVTQEKIKTPFGTSSDDFEIVEMLIDYWLSKQNGQKVSSNNISA